MYHSTAAGLPFALLFKCGTGKVCALEGLLSERTVSLSWSCVGINVTFEGLRCARKGMTAYYQATSDNS
jgi:hypothetical protein